MLLKDRKSPIGTVQETLNVYIITMTAARHPGAGNSWTGIPPFNPHRLSNTMHAMNTTPGNTAGYQSIVSLVEWQT